MRETVTFDVARRGTTVESTYLTNVAGTALIATATSEAGNARYSETDRQGRLASASEDSGRLNEGYGYHRRDSRWMRSTMPGSDRRRR